MEDVKPRRSSCRAVACALAVAVVPAACTTAGDALETEAIGQPLFDCRASDQRLRCAPPEKPGHRFVCRASGGPDGSYVKGTTSRYANPAQRRVELPPGASRDDLGWGKGLDCDCRPRACPDACAGAPAGAACDDADPCTDLGTCRGGVCQAGPPRCVARAVDECHVENGACDPQSGACKVVRLPVDTPCGADRVCDGDGACVPVVVEPPGPRPWPGRDAVAVVDAMATFTGNVSDLDHESSDPDVLWAVRDGPGALLRLVFDGARWGPDGGDWRAGKALRYPGGAGNPDAEGVTAAEPGGALYVGAERDNSRSAVSRNSVLRYDTSAPGATLVATHEWDLTADLPAVGSNLGIEALRWVPDGFLVSRSFFDERAGHTYVPDEYPGHGTGLFFVGLEADGRIYVYAIDHDGGGVARIAAFESGADTSKAIEFDPENGALWALCGQGCGNEHVVLSIDERPGSPTFGRFVERRRFRRPATMPDLKNEGFTLATRCVDGARVSLWSDDLDTGGHSLRADALPCGAFVAHARLTAGAALIAQGLSR